MFHTFQKKNPSFQALVLILHETIILIETFKGYSFSGFLSLKNLALRATVVAFGPPNMSLLLMAVHLQCIKDVVKTW